VANEPSRCVSCVDCGARLTVRASLQGRQDHVAYLCEACLEARVKAVQDPVKPPRRRRQPSGPEAGPHNDP